MTCVAEVFTNSLIFLLQNMNSFCDSHFFSKNINVFAIFQIRNSNTFIFALFHKQIPTFRLIKAFFKRIKLFSWYISLSVLSTILNTDVINITLTNNLFKILNN